MTKTHQEYFNSLNPNHPTPSERIDIYIPVVVEGKVLFDGNKRKHDVQGDRIQHIDINNKSVIDVGCNTGYISFRLAERGASNVLAIDVKDDLIKLGNTIKEIDGVTNIDFLKMDKGELVKPDCEVRNNPNFPFDIGLLMSNWHYDLCIQELNQYRGYATVWYIEPTNHEPHYKTKEEIIDWGTHELSKLGDVEFLTFTDYQHRGMFKLTIK
tara:strand:+ start:882 stop:1517 length:636 start_codon:yes stop_codon:yes gene_type:complete